MQKRKEANPGTVLRGLAISALVGEGLAGPNYSLDDISATVTVNNDSLHVSFWDMDRYIRKSNPYYSRLMKQMELE